MNDLNDHLKTLGDLDARDEAIQRVRDELQAHYLTPRGIEDVVDHIFSLSKWATESFLESLSDAVHGRPERLQCVVRSYAHSLALRNAPTVWRKECLRANEESLP